MRRKGIYIMRVHHVVKQLVACVFVASLYQGVAFGQMSNEPVAKRVNDQMKQTTNEMQKDVQSFGKSRVSPDPYYKQVEQQMKKDNQVMDKQIQASQKDVKKPFKAKYPIPTKAPKHPTEKFMETYDYQKDEKALRTQYQSYEKKVETFSNQMKGQEKYTAQQHMTDYKNGEESLKSTDQKSQAGLKSTYEANSKKNDRLIDQKGSKIVSSYQNEKGRLKGEYDKATQDSKASFDQFTKENKEEIQKSESMWQKIVDFFK